jgi:hypothetical protein
MSSDAGVELFHVNKPSLRFQHVSQKQPESNDERIRRVVCAVPAYIADFLDCLRWEHSVAQMPHPSQRRWRERWSGEIVEVFAVEKCPAQYGVTLGDFRELRAEGYRLSEITRKRGPLSVVPCSACGHVRVTA